MPLVNAPNDRKSFTEYCLRRLGKGVIEINVSEEQVSDRINDALLFWWDWAMDGTEHAYYKYQVTATDITNQYITLPPNIIGAVNIFDIGNALNTENMFDIRYQIALNDLYTLTSFSVVPYYMAMEHLSLLEQILVGKKPVRYNRYDNILYVDMDWLEQLVSGGQWIVVDCYQIVDPDSLANAYQDRLLSQYATALIKRQWGSNIKLYGGVQMLGGVQFNGQAIYDEAAAEIKDIEENQIWKYTGRPLDMIG
jgi:hypothetical protein